MKLPVTLAALGTAVGVAITNANDHVDSGQHARALLDLSVIALATLAAYGVIRSLGRPPTWTRGLTVKPLHVEQENGTAITPGVVLHCDRCGNTLPFLPDAPLARLFSYSRIHALHMCPPHEAPKSAS